MRSGQWITAPVAAVALLVGACGGGGDDGSSDDAAAPPPSTGTTSETTAEATTQSADCVLSTEQARELSGLPIDVVEARSAGVQECRYFEGSSENSAPKLRYRFRPGALQEKDGEPVSVAGSDARYNPTTGTLLIQVGEGELLDVKGFQVSQENLVSVGAAIMGAPG